MTEFFARSWESIWNDAFLADRVTGLLLALLTLSVAAMLAGALADPFLRLAYQRAVNAWRLQESAKGRNVEGKVPPEGEIEPNAVQALFWSLCGNLPVSTGATIILFLLLGLLGLERPMRWAGAAAAIPAMLVLLQYVYLWSHRPAPANDAKGSDGPEPQDRRAQMALHSSYGPRTLFIRYGFPAIVLLVECLVLAFVLIDNKAFLQVYPEVVSGARYGAVGAYAWVVIELGRRTFRRDVTSGIALWCVVTLVVGPLLAGTLALIWKPNLTNDDAWQAAVVLFYAGYAPRKVLAAVTSAASKLLDGSPTPKVEARSTPLTKIRGITPQIEERLAEEGVDNVENLATVEPFRLQRDTPYDLRTIIWWIDEAILMRYLPQRWEMLEEKGITGAIDLADLSRTAEPPNGDAALQAQQTADEAQQTADEAQQTADEAQRIAGESERTKDTTLARRVEDAERAVILLAELAKHINMTETAFRSLAARVHSDPHVSYVWWLYDRYTTDGANRTGDSGAPPIGSQASSQCGPAGTEKAHGAPNEDAGNDSEPDTKSR